MFLSKGRLCLVLCLDVLELCFCVPEAPHKHVHLSDGLLILEQSSFKPSLLIEEIGITGSTVHETELFKLTEFKAVFDKALTLSESLSSS